MYRDPYSELVLARRGQTSTSVTYVAQDLERGNRKGRSTKQGKKERQQKTMPRARQARHPESSESEYRGAKASESPESRWSTPGSVAEAPVGKKDAIWQIAWDFGESAYLTEQEQNHLRSCRTTRHPAPPAPVMATCRLRVFCSNASKCSHVTGPPRRLRTRTPHVSVNHIAFLETRVPLPQKSNESIQNIPSDSHTRCTEQRRNDRRHHGLLTSPHR